MKTSTQRSRPARFRRWLGWTRDVPTIGVSLDDDEVRVLCLRRRSVVTACGRASLPTGTARSGRIRVAGPAADGLGALRSRLRLPTASRVVMLVQPRSVEVVSGTVVARLEAEEIGIRRRVARAAGFDDIAIDPVPAAVERLAGRGPQPRYAEGAGWRTYRDGEHLEIEPSDRNLDDVTLGPSPAERTPLRRLDPITVDRGVQLIEPSALLLGATLADAPGLTPVRIDELAAGAGGAWTIERVGAAGPSGERRS